MRRCRLAAVLAPVIGLALVTTSPAAAATSADLVVRQTATSTQTGMALKVGVLRYDYVADIRRVLKSWLALQQSVARG